MDYETFIARILHAGAVNRDHAIRAYDYMDSAGEFEVGEDGQITAGDEDKIDYAVRVTKK